MPDVVLVPVLSLLDDELSVEQHEATHDEQPQVHMRLEDHDGAEEQVEQRHEEEEGESGHEHASEVQVAAAFGVERTQSEADEDH